MAIVSLRGIGKRYRISSSRQERLKEILSVGRLKRSHHFWALGDVSLDVEPGTTLGIVGRNGAGKSTLLKIISGIVQPTTGTVEVNGRLAALFGVGAGFSAEFTGRENVMLNGLLLGIERNDMLERLEEIETFADIGEFMDQPVKTYSSGMRARLGFAVAVNVEPDILVVDETLSVGDAVFKQMGLQKMRDLRDSGTTILFVSHSLGMVRSFCDKAVLLHEGRLLASGNTSETLDRYEALISSIRAQQDPESDGQLGYEIETEEGEDVSATPSFKENPALDSKKAQIFRHGTGEARIRNVELLDELRQPTDKTTSGSTLTVRVHLQYIKAVKRSSLGVTIRNNAGIDVFSTSTALEKTPLGDRDEGERVVVDFMFEAPLRPGDYNVTAAVSYPQANRAYMDWIDVAATFKITRPEDRGATPGLVHLPTKIEIHDQNREQGSDSA
jgi:ABC-2 type transport system ATP-binding protein